MRTSSVMTPLAWQTYHELGFISLGKLLDEGQLNRLQSRLDDIMLGKADVVYERLMMQLDSESGAYEHSGAQTFGWKGPRLDYRKILYIEYDNVFKEFVQQPLFAEIYRHFHPSEQPFSYVRTMVMNKPANKGTDLPWHQDRWNVKEREPVFSIYVALDPATEQSGCVKAIPGSHKFGLLNRDCPKGLIEDDHLRQHYRADSAIPWELEAGEVVLMDRLCIHSSGRNSSVHPRRALSILC